MKILSIEQIRACDAYTIRHEPIADIDLMERAARQLYDWITGRYAEDTEFWIYCGTGNNGGDGLALARMLHEAGFTVQVLMARIGKSCSPSCQENLNRFRKLKGNRFDEILEPENIKVPPEGAVIIDALFGSGLSRPVKGLPAEIIKKLNPLPNEKIATDAPSGFFCDKTNRDNDGAIFRADITLSFQFPRLGFMFAENEEYVGSWEVLPIGLHPDYIRSVETPWHYLLSADLSSLIRKRRRFAHKGSFGHALLLAGSYGKAGAAVLAAHAAKRAGTGLLTVRLPSKSVPVMQTAFPEGMVSPDSHEEYISSLPDLSPYSAVGAGPGLGTARATQGVLKLLIQNTVQPLVLDADALNILAENKTWLAFLPPGTILTPHPGEFRRLAGPSSDGFEQLEKARELAGRYKLVIVLKGAFTAVVMPDRKVWFNPTGNPGMATGGSGDALTGVILGLLARGYPPEDAARLGVFLHGLAGDLAAEEESEEALITSDIINHLGKAWQYLFREVQKH